MNLAFRTALLSGTRITAFTPLSLFASGEQGAWYDPSDMSTMFQDAAGTTPVTAVEQPVSLLLDKSKSLALGSELVTNGDFSNGLTGWTNNSNGTGTATVSSGVLTLTRGVDFSNRGRVDQPVTTVVGATYVVTGNVSGLSIQVATTNGGASFAESSTGTLYFIATSTTTFVVIVNITNNSTGTADNISVKNIAGSHAYTPSTATASRPVLSARYNLLTKTEQFNDADWNKSGLLAFGSGSVANTTATTDPLGGNTADYIRESSDNSSHHVQFIVIPAAVIGVSYRASVFAKAAERSFLQITFSGSTHPSTQYANFDLSTGAVGNNSGGTASITSIGNGWYRCTWESTANGTGIGGPVYAIINADTASRLPAYTGNSASGIYIWGADLRVANDGVALPAYQRVNTSTDYDTTNFPMYLRFDGSDDYMLTGTITPGTDKAQVFAGARKQTSSTGMLVELSATIASNSGLAIDQSQSDNTASTGPVGARSYATWNSTQPITTVLSICADRAGLTAAEEWPVMRQNGVPLSPVFTLNGGSSGNFLAYPLYIGRRGGTTLPFNGRIYGLIVRFGANLDNTQITNTETWMNGKTKAY